MIFGFGTDWFSTGDTGPNTEFENGFDLHSRSSEKVSNFIFENDINDILNDEDITISKTLLLILMFVTTINIIVK